MDKASVLVVDDDESIRKYLSMLLSSLGYQVIAVDSGEQAAARLSAGDGELVTADARMLRIKEIARQVADTDAPVLILGESGVGKEVLARFLHARSRRSRQPFIKVNCAALPEDLLESELFGYERGAFSGAFREKPGMFELADKG